MSIADNKIQRKPALSCFGGDIFSSNARFILSRDGSRETKTIELFVAPPRLDEDAPSPANVMISIPIGLRETSGDDIYEDLYYFSETETTLLRHCWRIGKLETTEKNSRIIYSGNFISDGDDKKLRQLQYAISHSLDTHLADNLDCPIIRILRKGELGVPLEHAPFKFEGYEVNPQPSQMPFNSLHFKGFAIDLFPKEIPIERYMTLYLSSSVVVDFNGDENTFAKQNAFFPLVIKLEEEFDQLSEGDLRRIGCEDIYFFHRDHNNRKNFHLSAHGYASYTALPCKNHFLKVYNKDEYTFDKIPDRSKLNERADCLSEILKQEDNLYATFEENQIIRALRDKKFYELSV